MVSIKSVLSPFRLDLSKREPIALRVELTNDSTETKLITFRLIVAKDLSVESTGISNSLEKRLGEIAPGKTYLKYFDIYPKVSTREKDYPARMIIYEHYNEYEFVEREYKKDFIVKVMRT